MQLGSQFNQLGGAPAVLSALIDCGEDAVFFLDESLLVSYWSASATHVYGLQPDEILGKSFFTLIPDSQLDAWRGACAKAFAGREAGPCRLKFSRPEKEPSGQTILDLSLSFSPIKAEGAPATGLVVLSRDMTAEKRAQNELSHAREVADAASQAKSQLIANMSHEMRTPLAAIQGYAEMMYDSRQTVTERLHCIGRIRHHLKNITELVDDILDLSKVESGKTEICPVTFSLLPELGEIFALLQSQAWKKRLSFDVTFEGQVPETIHTDPSRFRQVLVNVVGNAIKFTERGGVKITIKLSPEATCAKLCIVVADTGCGIGEEQKVALFQPFVQGDGSLTRPYGGTGLGLALSRRVAHTLGGDVTLIRSQPDRGSMFMITLDPGPREGVRMLENVTKNDLNVRQPTPIILNERKLNGMRLLLVEDAPDIQILVSHFLKRSGAQVDVAADGYEGIKKARTGKYDLILMDIQMPVLNGYEATAQLLKDGFKIPIVALTAHAMKGTREKCLQAGCDDYLTKPINAAALIELILRYYNRGKGVA